MKVQPNNQGPQRAKECKNFLGLLVDCLAEESITSGASRTITCAERMYSIFLNHYIACFLEPCCGKTALAAIEQRHEK